jgi:serine/threonine protein kinase
VRLPDRIHRYQIRSLIGRATFYLVWIAFDDVMQENVAIKTLKFSQNEMFEDESMINRHLANHITSMPRLSSSAVTFLTSITHAWYSSLHPRTFSRYRITSMIHLLAFPSI